MWFFACFPMMQVIFVVIEYKISHVFDKVDFNDLVSSLHLASGIKKPEAQETR
jgi:hypothetical protein